MNEPLTAAERRALKKIVSRAGKKNVEKHGVEHMRKIGAMGGRKGKGKTRRKS